MLEYYLMIVFFENGVYGFVGCAYALGLIGDHGATGVCVVQLGSSVINPRDQKSNAIRSAHWLFLLATVPLSEIQSQVTHALPDALHPHLLVIHEMMVLTLHSCMFHQCLVLYVILYYTILYYIILYYTILYYTILHDTDQTRPIQTRPETTKPN